MEGVFEVEQDGLKSLFEENDLDYFGECVIRRELTPGGKSRAFVNDTPVTLDILRTLTGALVDLHEQFDTLDINNVSFQLRMVDALAGNKSLLGTYQSHYSKFIKDRNHLEQLKSRSEQASRDSEFLTFQLEEFSKAELEDGEQERLEEEQSRLTHAEEIKRTLSAAYQFLAEGEQPLTGQLQDVLRTISDIKKYDPAIPHLFERLESILLDLGDMADEFGKLAEGTAYDPGRIMEIQERLDLIYRLQNKHHVATVADLLAIQQDLQNKLDAIGDLSAEIVKLEIEQSNQEKNLRKLAGQMSKRRRSVTPGFEKKVLTMLAKISMPHTRFEVNFSAPGQLSPTGTDEVNFRFAANPGSRMQYIKDVASGGELSRLTLVTKSLVAKAIPLPTLIFDEIDAGVGGDVSLRMGTILRRLADQHQVILITHSPQIAAQADAHYFVYKKVEHNNTFTRVKHLNDDERVRAIAVMLSQNPPGEAALANARELMGG